MSRGVSPTKKIFSRLTMPKLFAEASSAFLTSPLLFIILSPNPPNLKYFFNPTFSSFNHAIASILPVTKPIGIFNL